MPDRTLIARRLVALAASVLLAVPIVMVGGPAIAWDVAASGPDPAAGTVVVTLAATADAARTDALATARGLTRVGAIPAIRTLQYRPPDGDVARASAFLATLPGVETAAPARRVTIAGSPDDPFFDQQWGLASIRATEAWTSSTGNGMVVAVVDTGVDVTNPDLTSQVLPGHDFLGGGATMTDPVGHGTHVAGIVAAQTNNGQLGAGTAPDARILPVRVIGPDGSGEDVTVAAGITWAADHGARVINLSLGGDGASAVITKAIDHAIAAGAVVVAASGNEGAATIDYPAAYGPVIAVGALDSDGTVAGYSSHGAGLDVVAPGTHILSTFPLAKASSGAAWGDGTSMATPFVSGIAALVLSVDPSLTPAQVTKIIERSAHDIGAAGYDTTSGFGQVDAAAAVLAAGGATGTPTPSPTASPRPSGTPDPGASPTPDPSPSPSTGAAPTPGAPSASDAIPPSVRPFGALSGAVARGVVTVGATASDPAGVATIGLWRSGTLVGATPAGGIQERWDTRGGADGVQRWTIVAVDGAGNKATVAADVLVANERAAAALTRSIVAAPGTPVASTVRLGVASPLVVRLSGPVGARLTLDLIGPTGRRIARRTATASMSVTFARLGAGTYRIDVSSTAAGARVALRAAWFAR